MCFWNYSMFNVLMKLYYSIADDLVIKCDTVAKLYKNVSDDVLVNLT